MALLMLWLFVRATQKQGVAAGIKALFSLRVLLFLLLAVCISLLSTSLVFIEPQEVGVVISVLAPRGVRDQPLRSGLHWIAPLAEQVIVYPIYWQTYTMSGKPLEGEKVGNDSITARTSDGQEVSIDCSVIFRIDYEQVVRIHIDWQERYTQDFIRPLTRGLVRTEVSQYTVNEVNSSKRQDLESTLDRRMREELENMGLVLDAFILRNITFSPEYAAAVEQKQVALEGVTRKQHEAEQIKIQANAEAEATKVKAQAQSEALRLIAAAIAENSDLLTYQYIDKLAPNIKVMLVPNNAPLILPLPELEPATVPTGTLPAATGAPTAPPSPTPTP
ncbi:MAG: prohibitin family protein [Chloroflexi bacterium]|nr:prohibitin family protein [Chloroflexota bacterium]MBU1746337.1 prohibitin family protein [Chloroflexota bacterium]MBU1879246.1 prohibitin family protein [Chloroflexota bacterium]